MFSNYNNEKRGNHCTYSIIFSSCRSLFASNFVKKISMSFLSRCLVGLTILIGSIQSLPAQTVQWMRGTGSVNTDDFLKPQTVRTDNAGNVIVIGTFTGSFDFNPAVAVNQWTTASLTATDVYIQKFNFAGNLLWTAAFQGNGIVTAQGLYVDAAGDVYISGSFDTPTDFNSAPGITYTNPLGFKDAYVCKINNAGVFQWVKTFGDSGSVGNVSAARICGIGNDIVVSGSFGSTIDFNPGPAQNNLTATSYADMFLLRLTNNGDYVWGQSMSGTDFADVYGLAVDASNNIWLSGEFLGTIDFNPSPAIDTLSSTPFNSHVFVAKYNANGDYTWAGSIGGNGIVGNRSLALDPAGNVYLACHFSDTLDANPGAGSQLFIGQGFLDALIIKLNSSGIYQWAGKMGGASDDMLSDIIVKNNMVHGIGYFSDTADLDPGASVNQLISNGDYDMFYVALQTSGQFLQARRVGATSTDAGFSLALNTTNELYILGIYTLTVDFNPSPLSIFNSTSQSTQNGDQFLVKWILCANLPFTSLSASDCNSYTLNGQTYTASGVYTQVLSGPNTCDSIVSLNLTIGNNNVTINHVQCNGNSYTLNGQTYTTPGTYTQFYTNQINCDSNITLNLSFGVPSSATINANACDFYFLGNDIYFNSGTYTQIIPNASGCDSVVTLNLTINNSVYNYQMIQSCGPYVYNGQTISMPGYYSFFYSTVNGCDSVEEFDLTIEYPQLINQNASACQQHFFNGQWLTSSGVYNAVYMGSNGCDSTISLNLTIIAPNVTVTQAGATLTAVPNAQATYRWINCATNQAIPGATQSAFTATANGSYAVIVTINGCADTSLCRTVSGLSTLDVENSWLASLYPNPATQEVYITWPANGEPTQLAVYTMSGQLMYQAKNLRENTHQVATEQWAPGVYLVYLEQAGKRSVLKLKKEN